MDSAALILENFLTQRRMPVDLLGLDLLARMDTWKLPSEVFPIYPGYDPQTIWHYLDRLIDGSFLVVEHSQAAELDLAYERSWPWAATAGLYHFAMKDPPFVRPQHVVQWLEHRAATVPAVQLFTTNAAFDVVQRLPPPDVGSGVLSVMYRRRSIRTCVRAPMRLDALRDCLFAATGITGFLDTHVSGEAKHVPLKMTPSGGGRNPYEAYVWALRVSDLPVGVYHYSAIDNSLGLVTDSPGLTPTELLAGAFWAEDAGAIILLVANFERTAWKYLHPTAYRVVLIEAGHIAQNICLVAAEHGLSATPTAAYSDTAAQQLLNLDWIKQSLVYAIHVGLPHPSAPEWKDFTPHAHPHPIDQPTA